MEMAAVQIQQLLNYGVCRCCLKKGYHKDLTKEYFENGDREVYAETFVECFRISFDTNNLSHLICMSCVQRLRDANSFREMVLISESQLSDPLLRDGGLSPGHIKAEYVKDEYEVSNIDILENCFEAPCSSPPSSEDAFKGESSQEWLEVGPAEWDQLPVEWDELVPGELELLQRFSVPPPPLPSAPPEGFMACLRQFDGQIVTARDVERIMIETDEMSQNAERHRFTEKKGLIVNIINILKYSNATPFRSKTAQGFPCYYCRTPLQRLDDIRLHVREKHAEEISSPKSLFWKYGPESIVVNVDITDLKCNLCQLAMGNLTELKKHLDETHKILMCWSYTDRVIPYKLTGSTYECQVCGCVLETFGAVERHMNNHFRNYICSTCGNGFVTKTRLKVHQKTHSDGVGPLKVCGLCSKSYNSTQKLKHHIDNVHKMVKRFKCPQCSERFTEYFTRQKHMVEVHGCAPIVYKCNCCDKSFSRRFDLTRHLKKDHLREKNNECEYCGYKSFSRSEMRVHKIKHEGERTHVCPVCAKAYARKKTLTEHMKIHNNDRRHTCEVCSQAFIQKCSLKGHIKTHHPELVVD